VSAIGGPPAARPEKSPAAFRTIGEVAGDLDLPTHVLRFWESKFPQLKPLKRGGGRRYYRPEDVQLLRRIRQCLYQDGYTIRGVQKLLGDPRSGDESETGPAIASLFPLDAASDSDTSGDTGDAVAPREAPPPPPARHQRRRPPGPQAQDPTRRAELEDIRRDLLEARALLESLLGSRDND
jgi:DNA-binding transcriptional MerR regulator